MYAVFIQPSNDPTATLSHYCSYSREGDALAAVSDEVTEQFDLAALYPIPVDEAAANIDVDGKVVGAWVARVRGAVGTDLIVVVDDGEPAPGRRFFNQEVMLEPTERIKVLAPSEYDTEHNNAVAQLSMDNGTAWVTMPALDRESLLALHAALGDVIAMTAEYAYCDQCKAPRRVLESNSGPGFYGSMSWTTFACGHSDVDEDTPTP